MDFELSFGQLYRNSAEFTNADVIIVLDCCFSGAATRAIGQEERSVEIIAAVGSSQEAFGNASNQVRLQQKTFTSRLADEVARVVGDLAKSSVAFAEIINSMRAVSNPDRLPEYRLRRGTIGIRLGIPEKSRSAVQKYIPPKGRQFGHSQSSSSGSALPPPGLMAVFKIHIDTSDSKARKSEIWCSRYTNWTQASVSSLMVFLKGSQRRSLSWLRGARGPSCVAFAGSSCCARREVVTGNRPFCRRWRQRVCFKGNVILKSTAATSRRIFAKKIWILKARIETIRIPYGLTETFTVQ